MHNFIEQILAQLKEAHKELAITLFQSIQIEEKYTLKAEDV